jgi:hypothetical protein
MPDLFELSIPWWEIVLRGTVVYFVLLLLLRLSGKRTVGQFTPFDLLVLVLLGDAMQGTAADIIKRAMVAIDAWLAPHAERAKMILQVHDELVFEADEDFIDTLLAQAPLLMSSAAELRVPLVVDSGVGSNWDEAH